MVRVAIFVGLVLAAGAVQDSNTSQVSPEWPWSRRRRSTTTTGPISVTTSDPAPIASPPADAHEVAAWLNQLYSGFDENDDSSPLGVTISMANEFALYCNTECFQGFADCRLSASVYNHKVVRSRSKNAIKMTMNRVAGFVVNQTRVESSLAKCSYMFDGASFNRYHNACGCASRTSDCNDETSAHGNVCPSSGKRCTASDPEVSRCSCTNTPIPDRSDHPQCYFEGPAFDIGSEDQTRTMLKERIKRQNGTDSHDRLEYWNEVVLDENVMMEQLMVDAAAVIPAFVYVKSSSAGLINARKLRDEFVKRYSVQGIPLIAIEDRMSTANGQGPFIAEMDEFATPSVSV